jgi:hypothetical protein
MRILIKRLWCRWMHREHWITGDLALPLHLTPEEALLVWCGKCGLAWHRKVLKERII